jgi:hypothetical protein
MEARLSSTCMMGEEKQHAWLQRCNMEDANRTCNEIIQAVAG